MRIWIDADSCPKVIKDIVFRASQRLKITVYVVANRRLAVPESPLITMIRVGKEFNEADYRIAAEVRSGDIVITADIVLAAEVVEKGALALDPRGECYTPENVRERLSVRNFMQDLRAAGYLHGGPAPFGQTERRRFAAALDTLLVHNKGKGWQA